MSSYHSSLSALPSLTIYRGILDDPIVKGVIKHLEVLSSPTGAIDPTHSYSNVYRLLAETCNPFTQGVDAWQNYLLDLILKDVNPFSQASFTQEADSSVFIDAVRWDLSILRSLFDFTADYMHEASMSILQCFYHATEEDTPLPPLVGNPQLKLSQNLFYQYCVEIKTVFADTSSWDELAQDLSDYYATCGCGVFSTATAFKWENNALCGVDRPDSVRLSELMDYTDTRQQIIDNTLQFINGFPANNLLFYGDRGTGKSSTIKALLNEFWPLGLRLVELPKNKLNFYQQVIRELRGYKHKYMLFIDDLSFEDNETDYKDFKSLLEGGVDERPDNIIIYATSNRRHFIKETFDDRTQNERSEIHSMDSVQEKLSLADRFGMTILFPSPDQETFIKIVYELAQQKQLDLPKQELRQYALKWSMWHNGHSPRSAKQFIDNLTGKLALAKLT